MELFPDNRGTRQPLGSFHPLFGVSKLRLAVRFVLVKIKIECELSYHGRNMKNAEITAKPGIAMLDLGFLLSQKFFFSDKLVVGNVLNDWLSARFGERTGSTTYSQLCQILFFFQYAHLFLCFSISCPNCST